MIKRFALVLATLTLLTPTSNASLLDSVFPFSSVNRPEVWQDQLGGFATGGSIHTRVPTTNLKLLHLDLPSLKGGCGGIDLFGGGFGYINSANIEKLVKNIGTNALSYGVMLTIKSLSSVVSDLLENLEAMARFINGQNINSCQIGASIASGLFPKTEASQDLACSARKMGDPNSVGGHLSSYFTARYDCQDPGKRAETDKDDSSLLGTEYNLVWKALEKMSGSTDNDLGREDKQFLMSLSGTLIAKTENGKQGFEHKHTLIKNAQILDTIVFGSSSGHIALYKCDGGDKCLNPTVGSTNFAADKSVVTKVKTLLNSISEKIINENHGSTGSASHNASGQADANNGLSAEERHLATTTSIPIIKLIALNAGLKGHGVSLTVEDYAEAVAFDYVTSYLDSLLDFVYLALGNLEHAQMDGEKIKAFKEEIRHVKQMLFFERVKAFERLNTLLSVKMRAQAIEKTVLSHFIEYRST